MEASNTAKNPKILELEKTSPDAANIAPIIITLEIALVTDIKGACKAGVTFQTT